MKRLPSVAIVGRPNVGKSTLFNRITGRRRAIVHATPGVTRDVQTSEAEWAGSRFSIIDTGGLFSGIDDTLITQVESRALAEAMASDIMLFVTDGESGLMPGDTDVAERIRAAGVPVLIVVNKCEGKKTRNAGGDFYRLGFDTVYEVSALHGQGIGDVLDDVVAALPRHNSEATHEDLRLALIGMPNVGKSSLANALVGSDASIVDERPGTTRDSIDISIKWQGRRITLVDTAGLKRKSRSKDDITILSALKSLDSIERCDVAVMMLDASRPISNQDVKVASYAHKAGKGVLVCFNKWDLVEKDSKTYREYEKDFRERFAFMPYAPIEFISVHDGQRLGRVVEKAWHIKEEREKRIPTAEFNRFLDAAVKTQPPPFYGGGTGKVYYGTQVDVKPPTFAIFVNKAQYFGRNYLRYLNNRVREAFTFSGTLIRLNLMEKKREARE